MRGEPQEVSALVRWIHSLAAGQVAILAVVGIAATVIIFLYAESLDGVQVFEAIVGESGRSIDEWRRIQSLIRGMALIPGTFTSWMIFVWFGRNNNT